MTLTKSVSSRLTERSSGLALAKIAKVYFRRFFALLRESHDQDQDLRLLADRNVFPPLFLQRFFTLLAGVKLFFLTKSRLGLNQGPVLVSWV
ncbi:MAG: hypothetical protein F7O42_06780 [Opitutae bacterium]|nr:hypothetical protein [Opitutae bacterium]